MRRIFLVAVVFLCITALIIFRNSSDMVETTKVNTITITWVDARPTACGPEEKTGCAQWDNNFTKCVVTMPKDSPDMVVAHEFKHCFGFTHK